MITMTTRINSGVGQQLTKGLNLLRNFLKNLNLVKILPQQWPQLSTKFQKSGVMKGLSLQSEAEREDFPVLAVDWTQAMLLITK